METRDFSVSQIFFRYIPLLMCFLIISTPLHEWWHWFVSNLAGNEGYAWYSEWGSGGHFHYTSDPPYHWETLVRFSGGIGTFIIFGTIGGIRWRYSGLMAGIIPLLAGIVHLGYGIFEGLCRS